MNVRFHLIGGVALLASLNGTLAESPATNLPPGQLSSPSATNAQPETPAPPQAETKSAPGGQSPNGANGINLNGKPVTKSPNTPVRKSQAAAPAPAAPAAATASAGTPAPANSVPPVPEKQKTVTVLEAYLQDLNATLKLSPTEKKDIETYYTEDGATEQNILNDASLSPLEQTQKVYDLRTERNEKINALLGDLERQQEFARLEANYRVALTEAAAHGTLSPASSAAPAPASSSSPSNLTPGQAAPTPPANHPVE